MIHQTRRTYVVSALDAEPDAAEEVVRACGGLPLAVRIAAERLAARPTWPIAYLARALADEKHRLDELVAGDLAVRASIASSYQALTPRAQRLFRLLALASAQEVAGWVADVLLGEPAADLIGTLVDHSLLAITGIDALGQPRYRFHDLLREYATELLTTDPEASSARERMLAGWIELADLADADIPRALYVPLTSRPPIRTGAVGEAARQRVAADPHGWFATERLNLLATVEAACTAGQYRQARELALRTAPYLHLHSYYEDAERMWTLVGAAADRAGDVAFGARAWLRAAIVIAADRGHHARAVPLINRCITAFGGAGNWQRLARAYGVRCHCAQARGQLLQARTDGERGVGLARDIADPHAEFLCLRMLAVTYGRLGHHQDGITCAEQALGIAGDLAADTYRCAGLYALIKARLLVR
jgi:tetratricopeptide (TPR) repeat protein